MNTSVVRWTACVAAGLVGLTVLSSCAQDEREETMSIDATPAAVRAAIRQHVGEGTAVGEVERETENGKTVYEVEAVRDGRKMEYEFAEDGTLLSSGPEADDDDDDAGEVEDDDDDEDDDKPAAAAKG